MNVNLNTSFYSKNVSCSQKQQAPMSFGAKTKSTQDVLEDLRKNEKSPLRKEIIINMENICNEPGNPLKTYLDKQGPEKIKRIIDKTKNIAQEDGCFRDTQLIAAIMYQKIDDEVAPLSDKQIETWVANRHKEEKQNPIQ